MDETTSSPGCVEPSDKLQQNLGFIITEDLCVAHK